MVFSTLNIQSQSLWNQGLSSTKEIRKQPFPQINQISALLLKVIDILRTRFCVLSVKQMKSILWSSNIFECHQRQIKQTL